MTNYMELLMTNQPWNLIFFMAIPVILAESLVVTEFYCLWRGESGGVWHGLNRMIGMVVGIYFAAVFLYLATHVLPGIQWRGAADQLAIAAYLLGVLPLLSITFLELGIIGKNLKDRQRRQLHFLLRWKSCFP